MTSETPAAAQGSIPATTIKAIERVGGPATILAAVVTDVLAPLGPLTLYFAFAATLLFLIFLLPEGIAPAVHTFGERRFHSYWRVPVLLTVAVSIFLLVAAHFVTRSAPGGGWLASRVSAVRDLQDQLGVVEAQNREIAKTTHDIKKDTEEIKEKLDDVKQETSNDPRKELANLGVVWSTQSFVDATKAGDARVVRLFLAGGMSPTVLHESASAVLYMMQPKLPDPTPMLELMLEAGFDVNANLFDGLILRDYGQSFPPHFESSDLPADYAAWQGTFGGPVLLWLVIRSASGITAEWDLSVIDLLKRRGADTKLSRQFLEALEFAWGDFPAYQDVRAAIFD